LFCRVDGVRITLFDGGFGALHYPDPFTGYGH